MTTAPLKAVLTAAAALTMLAGTPVALKTLLEPTVPHAARTRPAGPQPELPVLPPPAAVPCDPTADIVLSVDGVAVTDPARKAALLAQTERDVRRFLLDAHAALPGPRARKI